MFIFIIIINYFSMFAILL